MADTIILIINISLDGDIDKVEKKYDPISLIPSENFILGDGNSYPNFWAFKIKDKTIQELAYLLQPMYDAPSTPIHTPIVLIKHEYYLPFDTIFTAEQLQSVLDSPTWNFLEVTEDNFVMKDEP